MGQAGLWRARLGRARLRYARARPDRLCVPHASRRHVRLTGRSPCQHCGCFAGSHCPPALYPKEYTASRPPARQTFRRPTHSESGSSHLPEAHSVLFASPSCAREAMSRTWAGRISVRVLGLQCDVRARSSLRQQLDRRELRPTHGLALRTVRRVAARCNMVRGVAACPSRCNMRCRQRPPTLRARSSSTRCRSAARYRPPHGTGRRPTPVAPCASCCTDRVMRAGGRESAAVDFARPRGARLASNQGTARRSTVLVY